MEHTPDNTSSNIFSTNEKLRIHFIGISGIGMSGIAEACVRRGHKVSGSDVAENINTHRLRQLSVSVAIGHSTVNIQSELSFVVISSAIQSENPELATAISKGIPVFYRSDILNALISEVKKSVTVTGTHGKTTTTALLGWLLTKAGLKPDIFCGGVMHQFNSTVHLPKSIESEVGITNKHSDWIVAEVDESDGSFRKFQATYTVLTNINDDHMTHFHNEQNLLAEFTSYLETNSREDSTVKLQIVGFDCPRTYKVLEDIRRRTPLHNKFLTFGLNEMSDIRGMNMKFSEIGTHFDAVVASNKKYVQNLFIPLHGEHNVQNALIAVAIAQELQIDDQILREALETFAGVDRRFTIRGTPRGITIVDDYAVHPKEIAVVLQSARRICSGRVIALVQIHRYTRLTFLFEDFVTCFDAADKIVFLPIYSPPGENQGKEQCDVAINAMASRLLSRGREVIFREDFDQIMQYMKGIAHKGDILVCVGAGTVTQLSHSLTHFLK